MSVYGKLDPMIEHRIQFCVQKQKRTYSQGQHAHIAYLNQVTLEYREIIQEIM